MSAYSYDFHIHSCLSPCGDNDMTPNNIVGMAAISGLEIIAITDHNTCRNAPAVLKAAEEAGITAIPGMELCTSEEAHIVCLFETLEGAMEFDRYIYDNMPHIKNKPEIFGEQRILNENDGLIGILDDLLLVASYIGADEVKALCEKYGGTAFPAHVDRDSYSLTAALGSIPPEGGYTFAEVTREADLAEVAGMYPELRSMGIVRDSDSHYLDTLATSVPHSMELPEKSVGAVLRLLSGK
ncbi:MAG: PHP domain-containing protein [Acutalibacter sp.]|jgi:PHP family Zn ribbon phosphoesterase|uniref:PHP domain-containing protein n=1 Tax=Acutalibacter sp. TaxID=1918636 RepID=UPI00216F63ED|nr:PHP domain-containing protein [Acutalibacter sp.]MCI9224219.1 PHP domain-containing protein [Acutalibacter sp.]